MSQIAQAILPPKVQMRVDEKGYYFEAAGKTAGPYSEFDLEQDLHLERKVAELLGVQPVDVFAARSEGGSTRTPKSTRLRDLDAAKISLEQDYVLRAQIIGESAKKALPRDVRIYCPSCRADETMPLTTPELQAALLFEGEAGLQKKLANTLTDPNPKGSQTCRHTGAKILDRLNYNDYRVLKLKDPPGLDEELIATDPKPIEGHAVGHVVPTSKLVVVRARVVVEPKNHDINLLITKTEPLDDEVSSFKLTAQDIESFRKYYANNPRLLDEVDGYLVPRLVSQTLRKQLMYLVLHSPTWIVLPDSTRIRGLLRLLVLGDTKT